MYNGTPRIFRVGHTWKNTSSHRTHRTRTRSSQQSFPTKFQRSDLRSVYCISSAGTNYGRLPGACLFCVPFLLKNSTIFVSVTGHEYWELQYPGCTVHLRPRSQQKGRLSVDNALSINNPVAQTLKRFWRAPGTISRHVVVRPNRHGHAVRA